MGAVIVLLTSGSGFSLLSTFTPQTLPGLIKSGSYFIKNPKEVGSLRSRRGSELRVSSPFLALNSIELWVWGFRVQGFMDFPQV